MKSLLLFAFFCLFAVSVYGEKAGPEALLFIPSSALAVRKAKADLKIQPGERNIDQSSVVKNTIGRENLQIEAQGNKQISGTKDRDDEQDSMAESKNNEQSQKDIKIEPKSSGAITENKSDKQDQKSVKIKPLGVITQKIRKVFEDFLEILEKESVKSDEYKKAVGFLENSLYSEASFESLKLLASVYGEKKDFKNQINVLNVLSVNYSNNPEAFYLLGMAYQNLYLNKEDDKEENKRKAVENINKALKINKKYVLAYEGLLSLLKEKHLETGEELHTKDSLSVVIDMLKNLKKNKYYVSLCKAYYDNNFLKQSRKTCFRSVKRNPKDPVSPLIWALSLLDKKKLSKELLEVAGKFKKSFLVQYKTALYFMDKDPKVAVTYFDSAYALQPERLELNQIMAQFLFDNKEEEKSYGHFLNACLFTEGKFLKNFRRAKNLLRKKHKVDLVLKFQKGIDQCFSEVKRKRKKADF